MRILCALFVALAAVTACEENKIPCNATTCPTGCCTAAGACSSGDTEASCGTSANACLRCAANQRCTARDCVTVATGGGMGSGTGGGSIGCGPNTCAGCCTSDDRCIRPPDNMTPAFCGLGGDVCRNCALTGNTCMAIGFCTANGGGAGGGAGGSTGGSGGGVGAADVTGHSIAIVRTGSGATSMSPLNLTTTTVQALVPQGDGGYVTIFGGGSLGGTFTVPNVPAGTFFLRVGQQYFETTQRQLNLDFERLGRAGVPPTAFTPLTLNITGLAPWSTATDQLRFTVPNLRLDAARFERSLSAAPDAGDTSTRGSVNFATLNTPLLNASMGDVALLTQVRTVTNAQVTSSAVVRHAELPPLSMLEGQSASATVGLLATTQLTQSLSWNLSAFAALKTELPPQGVQAGGDLTVVAYPGPFTLNASHSAGTLATVFVPDSTSPPDSLTFGSPFASPYSLGVRVGFNQINARRLPGTTTGGEFVSGLFSDGPLAQFTAPNMIAPTLGPVRLPLVNGQSLFSATGGVGLTPTLSWTAPSQGRPSRYYVVITRVSASGTVTVPEPSASVFWLGGTTFVVPAGVMSSGLSYVVQIGAIAVPNTVQLERDVYDWRVPYHESVVTSVVVSP